MIVRCLRRETQRGCKDHQWNHLCLTIEGFPASWHMPWVRSFYAHVTGMLSLLWRDVLCHVSRSCTSIQLVRFTHFWLHPTWGRLSRQTEQENHIPGGLLKFGRSLKSSAPAEVSPAVSWALIQLHRGLCAGRSPRVMRLFPGL